MKDNRKKREEDMRDDAVERDAFPDEEPLDLGEEALPAVGALEEPPQEELKRLKEELQRKAKEAADNYDRFLRTLADLDNYKKRVEKEKADIISFSNEKLMLEVLPVIDNLERALMHAEGGHNNLESLKTGVRLTVEGAYAVFEKYGLKEIKALGERFDPSLHHAISHETTLDSDPGTVTREFQRGYTLKGRLIRPSMVAVAKRPEGGDEGEGGEGES